MNAAHLEALKAIVTESRLTVKPDDLQVYGKDWTRSTPNPLAVVFPKTTDESQTAGQHP